MFALSDAWLLVELPVLMLVATFAPQRWWFGMSAVIERLKSQLGVSSLEKTQRGLAALPLLAANRENAIRIAASRTEHHVQILRELLWTWREPIFVNGVAHLKATLDRKRGAILWVAHFSFNALATKKGIHSAGIGVAHLSRPEHGFSKSRFGIRTFNPLRVRVEARYLKERIVIDPADPVSAIHRARSLLRDNQVISITAGAWEGAVLAPARLGDCVQDLSTGAPRLSLMTGAAIHPVFCFREEATGRMTVVIERALESAASDRDTFLASCTQLYADRLLPYVTRYPIQWRDWDKIMRPSR